MAQIKDLPCCRPKKFRKMGGGGGGGGGGALKVFHPSKNVP